MDVFTINSNFLSLAFLSDFDILEHKTKNILQEQLAG